MRRTGLRQGAMKGSEFNPCVIHDVRLVFVLISSTYEGCIGQSPEICRLPIEIHTRPYPATPFSIVLAISPVAE